MRNYTITHADSPLQFSFLSLSYIYKFQRWFLQQNFVHDMDMEKRNFSDLM